MIRFFGKASSLHYATARYLCYYLQEKRVLRRFSHKFSRPRQQDLTGWKTLKRVLNTADAILFQQEWEQFVLDASS